MKHIDIKTYRVDSYALAARLAAKVAREGDKLIAKGVAATPAEKRTVTKLRALNCILRTN